MEDVVQPSLFVSILTLCVTLATCVIGEVQGYRKMKLEHFETIYHCLEDFTKKRAKILDRCNQTIQELAEILPENDKKLDKIFLKKYDCIYKGMNQIIEEYSKCLEFYLAVSHFLYKYKSVRPIIKAECWSLLNVYEKIVEAGQQYQYKIQYAQIVDLAVFIRKTGGWKDKKALNEYMKKNRIFEF